MNDTPCQFQGYVIKPMIVPVLPDRSPSTIRITSRWIVLKDREPLTTPAFKTSHEAEEWVKQQR